MIETRTTKSIRNVRFALVFYFINLLLNFISRKVFIDHLGADLLGLNTTLVNVLGFLNLAELGIGNAVSFVLYKPLYEGRKQEINEIISIHGWLYKNIAFIIICLSIILLFLFPVMFSKEEIHLGYIYSTFIVLLLSSLTSYFISYKQIILIADQKEYLFTINYQGFKCIKIFLQILAICFFIHGYIFWLGIELIMYLLMALNINRVIKRQYPWLTPSFNEGKKNKSKYPVLFQKTKQVFFHKIGEFVINQSTPLIIYWYTSFVLVTIYGNYILIVSGITLLVNSIFNSLTAGIGNLVVEGNSIKIKKVFEESLVIRIWIVSIICFAMYKLSNSFVSLWVGSEFIMDQTSFILLISIVFINLTGVSNLFIAAYGLYKDVWAPVLGAVLNLILSITLGYFYGLSGVLGGVAISLFLLFVLWKPYLLFKYAFNEPLKKYWFLYLKCLLIMVFSCIISNFLIIRINLFIHKNEIINWMMQALLVISVYTFISLSIYYIFTDGMKSFFYRIYKYLKAFK